jgi:hypothetical protein
VTTPATLIAARGSVTGRWARLASQQARECDLGRGGGREWKREWAAPRGLGPSDVFYFLFFFFLVSFLFFLDFQIHKV